MLKIIEEFCLDVNKSAKFCCRRPVTFATESASLKIDVTSLGHEMKKIVLKRIPLSKPWKSSSKGGCFHVDRRRMAPMARIRPMICLRVRGSRRKITARMTVISG